MPWLVVIELVGSTYGAPFFFSTIYFAMVAALVLLSHRVVGPDARAQRHGMLARWLVGGLLLGLGLALAGGLFVALDMESPLRFVSRRTDVGLPLGLFGCWCITVGFAQLSGRSADWKDLERFGLLLGLAFLALLAGGYRVQGLSVFPHNAWARALLGISAIVVAGLAVPAGRYVGLRFVVLLFVGVLVRCAGLSVWDPDPAVRDMLPLAKSAGDALVRGEQPYAL